MENLRTIISEMGFTSELTEADKVYPFKVTTPEGAQIAISEHILTRIGLEFASPESVLRTSIEAYKQKACSTTWNEVARK